MQKKIEIPTAIPLEMFDMKHKGWTLTGNHIAVVIMEKPEKVGSLFIAKTEMDDDLMTIGFVTKHGADVFLYGDNTEIAGKEKFGVGCFVKFKKYAGDFEKKHTDKSERLITSNEVKAIFSHDDYLSLIGKGEGSE